jgi:hypothetical protein
MENKIVGTGFIIFGTAVSYYFYKDIKNIERPGGYQHTYTGMDRILTGLITGYCSIAIGIYSLLT